MVENKRRRQLFSNCFKISKSKSKPEQSPINNKEDRFIQEEKSIVEKIIKGNINMYKLFIDYLPLKTRLSRYVLQSTIFPITCALEITIVI